MFWLMILFTVNSIDLINSARVLGIFVASARSHFNFNRQIMYSLLEAGHQVTFVSPFHEPNPPINVTYIVPKRSRIADTSTNDLLRTDFKNLSVLQFFHLVHQLCFTRCSDLMETPEIQVSCRS